MIINDAIKYAGVTDRKIDLFEGQYKVPDGMTYNSYVILDEKVAVMDTVDRNFTHEWLDNLEKILAGRRPDYLVVSHMEPDHSANILTFMKVYPGTTVVATAKAFQMMNSFFGTDFAENSLTVTEGSTLPLGRRTLSFHTAPMVHWPEVVMTYIPEDKVLFSADAFGRFGDNDVNTPWDDEAARYYFGIVGKYGAQVQAVLKKAAGLDIQTICPLHGPVLNKDLEHYLGLYKTWSSYGTDKDGVLIAYTSVYGNTKKAVETLADELRKKGCPDVAVCDLARCDMSSAVSDAFRYGKIVLATTTYNAEIFPPMNTFLEALKERNFSNKTVGLIENGSWAPQAAKIMHEKLAACKNVAFCENIVRIRSALAEDSKKQLTALAEELTIDYVGRSAEQADKNDLKALFNIGYGLYVVTSSDGTRDNGLIVNTVSQVTNVPNRVAVCINKDNYSHHVIRQTGIMNVNCLSVKAPFSVFQNYGFRSGRSADKFEGVRELRSDNGLRFLPDYINSFMSLKVEQYVDLGTHGMFICSVTEARVLSKDETMTYTYYQNNVKPKPDTGGKKGFVCKVCGYVYEGEELPEDFVCPLCKHGPADFEPVS